MRIKVKNGCKGLFVLCCTSFAAVFGYATQGQYGRWIGDGEPEREEAAWYEEDPAGEFQTSFLPPSGAKTAKIHFAVAGFAVLEVNGKALTDESGLDTLWSVYGKSVYSRTFEVPVKEGENIVTVRLGNGFWNIVPLRFWGQKHFREKLAHGRPCFKMDIDGIPRPLVWKWRKTAVIRNCVYLGTEIDATRTKGEWRDAASVKGPAGRIVEWPAALKGTYCVGESLGKHCGNHKDRQVLDFGTNMTGVPEFVFRNEKRGTRIEIVYGERLHGDGTVNVFTQAAGQVKKNRCSGGPGAPETASQRDVYVCSGAAEERFSPPFTWHIYRYAEVRGAENAFKAGDAKRRNVSMLSTPRKIKTGNVQLDAIHDMCVRTFQSNMLGGIQSDCPGRERLGYGGDIVSTCDAYCLNWDMREIYLKILRDFADEAQDNGWITETAPYVGIADCGFGSSLRAGPLSWALAVPVLIDALLRYYDDERGLAFYPVCARYLRLVIAKCPYGLTAACLGDHEALHRPSRGVTATAHFYEFARLTASFAKRLGNKADAAEFDAMADKIKKAFAVRFVKNGVVDNGSQSAQSTALYLGLVPAPQRDAAIAHLIADLEKRNYAPTTGIFGTRYMLLFLSANGHVDIARRIVLRTDFPGFLHMINRGATTLWETWKESGNTYSNCHPMFGSVDEWILRYGID